MSSLSLPGRSSGEQASAFLVSCYMEHPSRLAISRLSAAESIAALLGRLDVSRFPWDEKLAVGVCQARAIDEWIDAYSECRSETRMPSSAPRLGPAIRGCAS